MRVVVGICDEKSKRQTPSHVLYFRRMTCLCHCLIDGGEKEREKRKKEGKKGLVHRVGLDSGSEAVRSVMRGDPRILISERVCPGYTPPRR